MYTCVTLWNIWRLLGAGVSLIVGLGAILCWKNQKIIRTSGETFVHSTMFGRKTTYSFQDITQIDTLYGRDKDWVLYLGRKKIHIDSSAIISQRFLNRLRQISPTLRIP